MFSRVHRYEKGESHSHTGFTETPAGKDADSAGDPSCLVGSAFLHPVDAHRARTMQFGLKYDF